eukprot:11928287-Prorocentrum_lima.AAC.1
MLLLPLLPLDIQFALNDIVICIPFGPDRHDLLSLVVRVGAFLDPFGQEVPQPVVPGYPPWPASA